MQRKYQIIGLIILMIVSVLYDYKKPTPLVKEEAKSYVVLEGAFNVKGKYEVDENMTMKQLIERVGIDDKANLEAINLKHKIIDEGHYYLPYKQKRTISLNKASKEELMQLPRVGEKTALKIMEYRKQERFERIEDIMNVGGIGEKTFKKMRDYLCL